MEDVEKLKKRIADLEKALMPIASAADEADEYGFDDNTQAPIDCGNCREARAVLDGTK